MLAVGPGGLDKEGKRVQCGVAPGDKVLIPQVGRSPLFVLGNQRDGQPVRRKEVGAMCQD